MKNLFIVFVISSLLFSWGVSVFQDDVNTEVPEIPQEFDETEEVKFLSDTCITISDKFAAHCQLSPEVFDIFAGLVEAESNRSMDGDLSGREFISLVVWNRVFSEEFPNSVEEVLYQPGQFRLPNGSVPYVQPTLYSQLAVVNAYDRKMNDPECPQVLFYNCIYWFSGRPRYGESDIGGNYFSL